MSNACTWTISTVDVTQSKRSDFTVDDDDAYGWVTGGAVEVYGLTSCSQYPVTGIFLSGISIYDRSATHQTPVWGSSIQASPSPSCAFNVTSTASAVQLYHNYTALSAYITADTATSIYTAHASGGVPSYSYLWEWCAIDCAGGDLRSPIGLPGTLSGATSGGAGVHPETVEHGWHDVGYYTSSICWVMSESTLRLTVTGAFGTPAITYYTVPDLSHTC